MKAAPFAVRTPTTVDEAVACLAAAGPMARVLAGEQTLMPLLAARAVHPGVVVDLGRVPGLAGIELTLDETGLGQLSIGSMVRQRTAERDPLVLSLVPLLAMAIRNIAHVTVRNQGTVGGSIANADPTAELPAAAVALDATMVVAGPTGERLVRAAEFFVGPLATSMRAGELLIAVRFPVTDAAAGSAFEEFSRRSGDVALASAAVVLGLGDDAHIVTAQIALGSVGPTPIRAHPAEAVLIGAQPSPELFAAAAATATSGLDPVDDLLATSAYRRHLAGVVLRRALIAASGRATQ